MYTGPIFSLNRHDDADQTIKDRIHARLLARSESDHETGCLIYTGSWDHAGKVKLRVGQRYYWLPRIAAWLFIEGFELWSARVPYHTCRSPACFNPDHLAIAESHSEALAHLRAKSVGHAGRRLNRRAAERIRENANTMTVGQQANREGVSQTAIRRVIEGQRWNPRILP